MRRTIAEIQADIKNAKRELKSALRAAGDDYGCDGTAEHCESLRGWIAHYEVELTDVRWERRKVANERAGLTVEGERAKLGIRYP